MNLSPNEYHVQTLSGTAASSNIAAILLAANLALGSSPPRVTEERNMNIRAVASTVGQFGSHPVAFSSVIAQPRPVEFEKSVASFYSALLANQEPLGRDFEQILHDNLWDLYVRS
jgi:hypothetical protein